LILQNSSGRKSKKFGGKKVESKNAGKEKVNTNLLQKRLDRKLFQKKFDQKRKHFQKRLDRKPDKRRDQPAQRLWLTEKYWFR